MDNDPADRAESNPGTAGLRRRLWAALVCAGIASSGCLTVERHVDWTGDGCLDACFVPSDCCGTDCVPVVPHVEVLRGITGYWPGAADFQEQLAARGIASTVSWCELYPTVADRLIETRRRHPQRPLVVVGYSLGANHALRLCRRLRDEGITVDRLVLLETTYEDTVPENVRCCFNAYKSRPLDQIPFMRGIPIEADSSATALTNYNFSTHDDGRYDGLNHLTLCRDEDVQALLANAVAAAFSCANAPVHVTPPDDTEIDLTQPTTPDEERPVPTDTLVPPGLIAPAID